LAGYAQLWGFAMVPFSDHRPFFMNGCRDLAGAGLWNTIMICRSITVIVPGLFAGATVLVGVLGTNRR